MTLDIHICDPVPGAVDDMLDYCQENSLSLIKFEISDVSDVSGQWDTIATFTFMKHDDATLFKLRWY